MINLQHSVPEIYYNQSRDFQFLARTLEVLANYAKTNVDAMKAFPFSDNFDIRLLTLLAYTIGFKSKHNYNSNDLFSLCASFDEILKYKGSLTAIEKSVRLLLNAQQIDKKAKVIENKSTKEILIYLPIEITDLVLLEDLFDYILPCGYTYSFIFAEFGDSYLGVELKTSAESKVKSYTSDKLGRIAKATDTRFSYDNPQDELAQTSTGVIVVKEG